MQPRVTPDVFSGRRNPSWQLDREQTAELVKRLAGLPAADGPPARPASRLGYRGFVVELGGETIRAGDRLVQTDRGVLADPDRTLERWLFATAPPDLEPAVSSVIAAALEH